MREHFGEFEPEPENPETEEAESVAFTEGSEAGNLSQNPYSPTEQSQQYNDFVEGFEFSHSNEDPSERTLSMRYRKRKGSRGNRNKSKAPHRRI